MARHLSATTAFAEHGSEFCAAVFGALRSPLFAGRHKPELLALVVTALPHLNDPGFDSLLRSIVVLLGDSERSLTWDDRAPILSLLSALVLEQSTRTLRGLSLAVDAEPLAMSRGLQVWYVGVVSIVWRSVFAGNGASVVDRLCALVRTDVHGKR